MAVEGKQSMGEGFEKQEKKKTVTSKLGNSTSTLLVSKSGGSRTKVRFKSKRMDMR